MTTFLEQQLITCEDAVHRFGANIRRDIECGFWCGRLSLRYQLNDEPINPRNVIFLLHGRGPYLPVADEEDNDDMSSEQRIIMVERLLPEYRARPPNSDTFWSSHISKWLVDMQELEKLCDETSDDDYPKNPSCHKKTVSAKQKPNKRGRKSAPKRDAVLEKMRKIGYDKVEQMKEEEWAATFNASRDTCRKAFKILEEEYSNNIST